jgi:hypothetical protein
MKPITAFQTSDGTLFELKLEAEKHEMSLSKRIGIEDYLDSDLNPYTGHAHRSMARNTIANWELWKVKNEITSE